MAYCVEIFLFICIICAVLISPAMSLACTSEKVTDNNVPFAQCIDLPTFNAFLHYTYDPANTSLSIAYTNSPPAGGWIAWGVNPAGMGMVGAQALIGYVGKKGTVVVMTSSIDSYSAAVASTLLIDNWDLRGEQAGAKMRIYGKVKVPTDFATKKMINHVWQVGPGASGGVITRHELDPPNLSSKGELKLEAKTAAAGGPSPVSAAPQTAAPAGSPAASSGPGAAPAGSPAASSGNGPASSAPAVASSEPVAASSEPVAASTVPAADSDGPPATASDTPESGVSRIRINDLGLFSGLLFVFIGSLVWF